jgi:rhodanese-related sulfurtransferase
MKSISVEDLYRRLEESSRPFLLDVREPQELPAGAIAGSVNIPMNEVGERLGELPPDRDIVVICHLGERSGYVARQLNDLGYDRAMNLRGGMEAWLARE